jgi:alkylation response protein AidB-like acyl-CoA dehydrogenase
VEQAVAGRENGHRRPGDEKPPGPEYLLDLAVDGFRRRVRDLVAQRLAPLVADAERNRRFPREAIGELGRAGLLRERWDGGTHGDLPKSAVVAEELGRAGLGGVGVGISLHLEAAVGTLRRFGRSRYAKEILDGALDGRYVCCVATSEQHAGSDLSSIATEMGPQQGKWRVTGTKWFVSPGPAADVVLTLCLGPEGPAVVLVPREAATVVKRLETAGMRGLETARLRIDAVVDDDAVLARPGLGLPAITFGLFHERLAIAAQILGSLDLVLTLTVTQLHRKRQFGAPLFDHQALRLRIADLVARTRLAQRGVHAAVRDLADGNAVSMREVAGMKVTAAQLGEEVISECLHVFGGRGYVEDETPMARLWRDLRIGRLGAGSDEMMWELVAGDLRTDGQVYERWISG